MSNEHIGRLKKVGLGKEVTAGTGVAATDWIPATERAFAPDVTKAKDESAYGTIDQLRESYTTREMTIAEIKGIFRDLFGGHLLNAALGTDTVTRLMVMAGGSGTWAVGETVTQATSGATGVVRRVIDATTLLVSVTSGVFTSGSNLVTGGTSAATGTPTYTSAQYAHLFTRLNSNNHPAYTIYGVDDVGVLRSSYCMIESLELEMKADGFLTFNSKWQGKKQASSTATPSYTTENHFMGSGASLKLGNTLALAYAATATAVTSFKLTIQKNLEAYQAFGTTDVLSIHNKQFRVFGEISALFNSTTLKALVTGSTKQSMILSVTNADASPAPILSIFIDQATFESWDEKAGNDELAMQTVGFEMEYSVANAEGIAIMLLNSRSTAY